MDYENTPAEERYKWVEYHKWNFDFRYYLPLIPKLVLAPRIHFGFIGTYSESVSPGPFERFVLGGDGLTRQNFILGTDVIGLRGYQNPQQLELYLKLFQSNKHKEMTKQEDFNAYYSAFKPEFKM